MKILQVNNFYLIGSTGKITRDIHNGLLEQGIESVVCYGRGEPVQAPHVYKTCWEPYARFDELATLVIGLPYGRHWLSTQKLISVIKKEKPDIVHLQCINCSFVNIYQLIRWLKRHHIKTVLSFHAEFMYTATCDYAMGCDKWLTGCGHCPQLKNRPHMIWDDTAVSWKRMKKAFEGFETACVVGVSEWVAEETKRSPIYAGIPVSRIHNGIHIENFHADWSAEEDAVLRKTYGIPENKRIILHVTPYLTHTKGGDIFLRLANRLPEGYHAVIVGQGGSFGDRITAIPFTTDQKELAGLYRMADVMVSTSRLDNYPTVCLEANCCGIPVVGFDVGGVKETIGAGMGEAVKPFDEDALLARVLYWSEEKKKISDEQIVSRREYCDRSRMVKDYVALYRRMLQEEL